MRVEWPTSDEQGSARLTVTYPGGEQRESVDVEQGYDEIALPEGVDEADVRVVMRPLDHRRQEVGQTVVLKEAVPREQITTWVERQRKSKPKKVVDAKTGDGAAILKNSGVSLDQMKDTGPKLEGNADEEASDRDRS